MEINKDFLKVSRQDFDIQLNELITKYKYFDNIRWPDKLFQNFSTNKSNTFIMNLSDNADVWATLMKLKSAVNKCGGIIIFDMKTNNSHGIKMIFCEESILNNNDEDIFHCQYFLDCLEQRKLLNINKYRIGKSHYTSDFDVMSILNGPNSWDDAKKKSSSDVSDHSDSYFGDDNLAHQKNKGNLKKIRRTCTIESSDNESIEESLCDCYFYFHKSRPAKKCAIGRKETSRGVFSVAEDLWIINYVFERNLYNNLGGRSMWQKMSRQKPKPKNLSYRRTWQSIKERFMLRILPNLEAYRPYINDSKIIEKTLALTSKLETTDDEAAVEEAVDDSSEHKKDPEYRYSNKNKKNRALKYSCAEKNNIVDFIIKNNLFSKIKGNTIYKNMEKKLKSPKKRTWQSLKNTFGRYILPNIEDFTQDQSAIAKFSTYAPKKNKKRAKKKPINDNVKLKRRKEHLEDGDVTVLELNSLGRNHKDDANEDSDFNDSESVNRGSSMISDSSSPDADTPELSGMKSAPEMSGQESTPELSVDILHSGSVTPELSNSELLLGSVAETTPKTKTKVDFSDRKTRSRKSSAEAFFIDNDSNSEDAEANNSTASENGKVRPLRIRKYPRMKTRKSAEVLSTKEKVLFLKKKD